MARLGIGMFSRVLAVDFSLDRNLMNDGNIF